MWEILQDNLNAANISEIQETHSQYWGIRMYGLGYNVKYFFTWILL